MTECSRPRRGMIMVASHFRSALPLRLSKNGWVKEVNGKRAFRYATIIGGVSRTYGTPAYAKYAIPAILRQAKRQSRAEMAGYHYQMPTASSLVTVQFQPKSSQVIFASLLKLNSCNSRNSWSYKKSFNSFKSWSKE